MNSEEALKGATNIIARFLNATNQHAMKEPDFVEAWTDVIMATMTMNPALSTQHVTQEIDRILQDLCGATHPVNDKGEPYAVSEAAYVQAAHKAATDIGLLVAS